MVFSRKAILSLLSAPLLAFAADNPFNIPAGGLMVTAGQPVTLSWNATTPGTVTILLRSGASSDLIAGASIASSITNSGSYVWTPATMITRGSDYVLSIVDDADTSRNSFSNYFVINSDNTVAYSTSQVTLGSVSTSVMISTASSTGTAVGVTSALSSSVAASSSASAAASSSASSASASSASSAASAKSTGSSTAAASTSSGAVASATSKASSAASSAAATTSAAAAASAAGVLAVPATMALLGLAAMWALVL